jgi:Zn-dependent peptidase ImmA (M78 family)
MISLIDPKINRETLSVTEYLSRRFCDNIKTDLQSICEDEGIPVILDNYDDAFDGLLTWNGTKFHIHLNETRGNLMTSRRGRFSLAHELGHFFLESHRTGIMSGAIPSHPSNHSLVHTDKIETEADFFAGNLLMPTGRLRAFTAKRKFSLDIIKDIANSFGVSLTAAVLRFAQVGTHDIMIVFSKDNIVEWSYRSDRFPKVANKFKKGKPLPPTTVAGESFLKQNAKYTSVETLDFEDWFIYKDWKPEWPLYEQCFYSDIYNYVVSVVWFK